MPFLSIVTRHYTKRTELFNRCVRSLESQTDQDFEHVVIKDEKGIGVERANTLLFVHRILVTGQYVFILDDDVWLTSNRFVSDMKRILTDGSLDVVIIKTERPSGTSPKNWGIAVRGEIDTACAVVKVDLWKSTIHRFLPIRGGDGIFIRHLLGRASNVFWYDRVYSKTDKARFGGL
jgi:hypothetical protein